MKVSSRSNSNDIYSSSEETNIILVLNGEKKYPDEKTNLLFIQCHPPPLNTVSGLMLVLCVALSTLSIGSFLLAGSIPLIGVADCAANIGGIAFGALCGANVKDRYTDAKTVIALVPESMMPSSLSKQLKDEVINDDSKSNDSSENGSNNSSVSEIHHLDDEEDR